MTHRSEYEYNRRYPVLRTDKVNEVLPSYFEEEYPHFVSFLRTYYDAMDQEGEVTSTLEYGLHNLRDFDEVSLRYIDRLFFEIGNGAASSYFSDPRLVGKLISILIQNRGNEYGAKLFFRLFFDDDITIEYPKNNLLIVFGGETADLPKSYIGPEALRYIQDGKKYQILSILIKSSIGFNSWSSFYKKFVHPVGFWLSSEVVIDGLATMSISSSGAINDLDIPDVLIEASAEFSVLSLGEMYSETGVDRHNVNSTLASYSETQIGYADAHYDNIAEITQFGSPTMDEDSDVGIKTIESSTDLETMDEAKGIQ